MSEQRQGLNSLLATTVERHDTLLRQSRSMTDEILTAIDEKVEKPTCPELPEPVVCEAAPRSPQTEDREGYANRLAGKLVVGERERFYLDGPGFVYVARIDSGAETSSLDARNIRRFERDGQNWVRFDIPVPNSNGQYRTLEREIVRNVRIIQANVDEYERRAVVELQFAIGNHRQKAEFTLTDREHLSNNVLIGRNILRDVMLIDVGKEFATELPASMLADKEPDQ
ncbi:MAG: RimK/LysX family protein [Marinobacter sp.]|uniref:ATP-dependent zinc protease family protein n=1 Tax=Marinobacter sp. TaxID=50741 RepID=UPI00299F32FA|nr:RimK/LysX family protein [Marinobacter sp.]MDX1754669.1 RimK/LysX family protein [Marinobacter sp.]